MAYQFTFQRYEIKYLLNQDEKQKILNAMKNYMELDNYGRTIIRNIYFDTDSFRLIRRSLERPAYKEKLRVRSYKQTKPWDPVFVELKKKYRSVVYKRRLAMPEKQVMTSLIDQKPLEAASQIGKEINYFLNYYENLMPKVFLTYEREAFYSLDKSDFRVTFDENILYREKDLSLCSRVYGKPILKEGKTLMEIKTSGGIPLWMSHVLTENRIFRTSFSKYGLAYQDIMRNETANNTYGRYLYA